MLRGGVVAPAPRTRQIKGHYSSVAERMAWAGGAIVGSEHSFREDWIETRNLPNSRVYAQPSSRANVGFYSCTTGLIQNRVSRLATRLARSTAKAKEQRVVYVEEEKPKRANSKERTRGPESRRVSYNDHGVRLEASAAKSFSLSLVLSLSLSATLRSSLLLEGPE